MKNKNEYKELSEEVKIFNENQINGFSDKHYNKYNYINKKESTSEEEYSKNTISLLTYNFFCRPPPINTNGKDYRLSDLIQ